MESNKSKIESPIKFLKIIWFAFFMTLMLFGFAAFTMIQASLDVSDSEVSEKVVFTESALFYPMVVWSFFAVILAFSLPKFLTQFLLASRKRQRQVEERLMVPDRLALHATGTHQINDQAADLIIAFIFRMALFESIALCGFVLAITTHQFEPYIYFVSVAVLLLFINYPNLESFNKRSHDSKG